MIAHVLTRSMATGARVRAVLRDGAGHHDGVVVRKEIDPRRVVKDPRKQRHGSCLIFTFADGRELAVNSMQAAVVLPQDR